MPEELEAEGISLEGKKIVVALTGSVAIVRSFDIVRALAGKGADVHVVMSDNALGFAREELFRFASGNDVITRLSGNAEHVSFFGQNGIADLLLIAPCTANTLGKIANGIADTVATLFAMSALGSGKPAIIAPAMDAGMYGNSAVMKNLEVLAEMGAKIVAPLECEGRAKIAANNELLLEVERACSSKALAGRYLVVSAGATEVDIDPIRVLTNKASGRTGLEIAREAYRQGARVSLIHNIKSASAIERQLNPVKVRTPEEMHKALMRELQLADVFVSTAAVSDFSVATSNEKIDSACGMSLALKQAPKLVKDVQGKFPGLFIVGFKAETNKSDSELAEITRRKMESEGWSMAVGNDVAKGGIGCKKNRVVILGCGKERWVEGSKQGIAEAVIGALCEETCKK